MDELDDVYQWVNTKIEETAQRGGSSIHENPASFSCGYNAGYKQAMLDLKRALEEDFM